MVVRIHRASKAAPAWQRRQQRRWQGADLTRCVVREREVGRRPAASLADFSLTREREAVRDAERLVELSLTRRGPETPWGRVL